MQVKDIHSAFKLKTTFTKNITGTVQIHPQLNKSILPTFVVISKVGISYALETQSPNANRECLELILETNLH
ncbi:hypothetical protein D9K80_04700 [Acinetobacter cumulans]|uniref:Uncharacterized protein n=1 Tax=Acinetobacter cumulans TaxID=2136182 RepID=A0A498D1L7_9GAMM|nr:hypothetical protein D9K80_04700 [Acinetobacter cumulans]